MSKEQSLSQALEGYTKELSNIIKAFSKGRNTNVASAKEKTYLATICTTWFDKFKLKLDGIGAGTVDIAEINDNFEKLLRYSRKDSNRKTVVSILDTNLKSIKELIHQLTVKKLSVISPTGIIQYFHGLNEDENQYLQEAFKCAEIGCVKAAIILGWCAGINRIHEFIDGKNGYSAFNAATIEMKNRTYGRYKRFDKTYRIASLNELREVFDTDLLWVIEFQEFIDNNQHERLRHCFTMRNNCSHPGDAGITPENLKSFFSDVANIIFNNPKLSLTNA